MWLIFSAAILCVACGFIGGMVTYAPKKVLKKEKQRPIRRLSIAKKELSRLNRTAMNFDGN